VRTAYGPIISSTSEGCSKLGGGKRLTGEDVAAEVDFRFYQRPGARHFGVGERERGDPLAAHDQVQVVPHLARSRHRERKRGDRPAVLGGERSLPEHPPAVPHLDAFPREIGDRRDFYARAAEALILAGRQRLHTWRRSLREAQAVHPEGVLVRSCAGMVEALSQNLHPSLLSETIPGELNVFGA
jgi:hypothetical protein